MGLTLEHLPALFSARARDEELDLQLWVDCRDLSEAWEEQDILPVGTGTKFGGVEKNNGEGGRRVLVEVREDRNERAVESGEGQSFLRLHFRRRESTYLIPTPPAMKTSLETGSCCERCGGGQTKLPPTRTKRGLFKISLVGRQSQAAGGFLGLCWIASSR